MLEQAATFTPAPETLAREFDIKSDRKFWGNAGTRIFATLPSYQWPQLSKISESTLLLLLINI